ncbi:MAG: SAM-dependent methyltransferase [Burkholderiaceae bacterium]|jgi:hypothetical protein
MPSSRPALRRPLLRAIAFAPLALALPSAAQDLPPVEKQPINAGPYVPSPDTVVSQMLEMAGVGPGDVLIDMGSGDGRIVLTAAKLRGAQGLGIEIDERLVRLSREAAQRDGVADRAKFVRQDLFNTDVSSATVVTIYLLPKTVDLLADKLRRDLRPGTRVISHDYPISGWLPESWRTFEEPEKKNATGVPTATVYLYRIPAPVGGTWQASVPTELTRQKVSLTLRQQWQMLDGMANVGGREVPLESVTLRGERVSFRLPIERGRVAEFEGVARGARIEGSVAVGDGRLPWQAARM